MGNTVFKVGDRVFHINYGWGEITDIVRSTMFPLYVKFDLGTLTFTMTGKESAKSKREMLSFTEYTLQGFSQERPIALPEVGELCLVRDYNDERWGLEIFCEYDPRDKYPYIVGADKNGYKQMKRIKILD